MANRIAADEQSIRVDRPIDAVAAYVCDIDRFAEWRYAVNSVEWESPRPATVGTRLLLVLGPKNHRQIYVVTSFDPGRCMVLRREHARSPIEIAYSFASHDGQTEVTVRRSMPVPRRRLSTPLAPLILQQLLRRMVLAMNRKELAQLQLLLASPDISGTPTP